MIQMFQAWITAFKQGKWMLMLSVFFLLISAMLFWFWQRTQQAEENYRQAVVLQQEQLEQAQELGKALHISQMNAKELQAAYDELKAKPPAASFSSCPTARPSCRNRIRAGNTKRRRKPRLIRTSRAKTKPVPPGPFQRVASMSINPL